ncbi:hypothetical protein Tco_0828760 [Tanacetum coccineum]
MNDSATLADGEQMDLQSEYRTSQHPDEVFGIFVSMRAMNLLVSNWCLQFKECRWSPKELEGCLTSRAFL